ncbi:MAG: MBL fold metallo-hydrolase [Candidatus Thiodiazotropha sp.]
MALRFAFLGSGSRGNALLVETPGARVLVDCGFTASETESRLKCLQVDPQTLSGILVTHEHGDHIRGVGVLARRYGIPVWMTPGTAGGADYGVLPDLRMIDCHAGYWLLEDLRVQPYPVPHDAREPCQFLLSHGGGCLGVLTDTGHVTPHIVETLQVCDGLVLEFNHDRQMLATGPYPKSLQVRVGGHHGHLSNDQALQLLSQLPVTRLCHLVASHISEKNNSPQRVKSLLAQHQPDLATRCQLAEQGGVSAWFDL